MLSKFERKKQELKSSLYTVCGKSLVDHQQYHHPLHRVLHQVHHCLQLLAFHTEFGNPEQGDPANYPCTYSDEHKVHQLY